MKTRTMTATAFTLAILPGIASALAPVVPMRPMLPPAALLAPSLDPAPNPDCAPGFVFDEVRALCVEKATPDAEKGD